MTVSENVVKASTGASTTPRLAVTGLDAGYNGIPAVRDVDLRLAPGEVVALLGSNGAGKTTTLSAIAGLIRPLKGAVHLDGQDITGGAAYRLARRGVALVPEDRALFHDLTTRGEPAPGPAWQAPATQRPRRGPRPAARAAQVSGSQGRLACRAGSSRCWPSGRALMSQPQVLLVDEMSMGLAPVVVDRVSPVLAKIASATGAAVLVVEQHVAIALDLAERAYVLAHGRIVLEGSTSRLRSRRDLLMACYLGDLEAAGRLADHAEP